MIQADPYMKNEGFNIVFVIMILYLYLWRFVLKLLLAHTPPLLVQEFAQQNHELCVAHIPGEWARDAQIRSSIHFECFPYRSKVDPRSIWQMRRMIQDFGPDIVHAFTPRSLAAASLAVTALKNPPYLVSFRGISTPPSPLDPANHITFLSSRVAAHACESQAVADALIKAGIHRHLCHVVYNCIPDIDHDLIEIGEFRQQHKIPHNAFVIGSVANIRPVKGIDILLSAALNCLDLQDIHVVLIGNVQDSTVERLIKDPRWKGRLHSTGFLPDGGKLACNFDLFVMPSRHEALCRALLEAMNTGTCPIVSDAGGMKEMVRHMVEGVVFPTGDIPALSKAIRNLHAHRDLIEKFGLASRKRVRTLCSPRTMVNRLEKIYSTVTGNNQNILSFPTDRSPRRAA